MKTIVATGFIILTCAFANAQSTSLRNTISLNGNWQIAEGTKDVIPKEFNHTVQVPGLVSLATPLFKESAPSREAFWYRRTFAIAGARPMLVWHQRNGIELQMKKVFLFKTSFQYGMEELAGINSQKS